jgi:hypothetical protein
MLQARSTTDAIFGDMGVAADSVDQLKVRHRPQVVSLCCCLIKMLAQTCCYVLRQQCWFSLALCSDCSWIIAIAVMTADEAHST